MYLKSLEVVGFKSFATPCRLEFEPGMTCIVGPNGCGKSNVLDAIRWCVGEQSAKLLRGAKMEDMIFSGTENLKPLGCAEVSVTFTECETALGTDYHEITITRRVHRSGEGEYLLNRVPCRLKDIQRLFMDTGIGTTSYSIMEQGRIDQILSSRPEDRREIFEEASGITKFKTDKNEALRKLEQTEANLLRLSDVVAEVKRQIGSLERQAGKARRYKASREELRKLDVYFTKNRLVSMDGEISALETRMTHFAEQLEAAQQDVNESEKDNAALRKDAMEIERRIENLMDLKQERSGKLESARNTLQMSTQYIAETRLLCAQDEEDIRNLTCHVERQRLQLDNLSRSLESARTELAAAEKRREEAVADLSAHDDETDKEKGNARSLQAELVEAENRIAGLRNELIGLDASERTDSIRRERLLTERSALEKEAEEYRSALSEIEDAKREMEKAAAEHVSRVESAAGDLAQKEQEKRRLDGITAGLHSDIAARRAQADMLTRPPAQDSAFPAGARALLDEANPLGIAKDAVLGSLASMLDAEPEFRLPFEAALRSWFDAVVIRDFPSASEILAKIGSDRRGAVRLLISSIPETPPLAPIEAPGEPLSRHVSHPDFAAGLVKRLLGNVRVVESVGDIPIPVPAGLTYVSMNGAVVRGDGAAEMWDPETDRDNPLVQKGLLSEARAQLADLESRRERAAGEAADAGNAADAARIELDRANAAAAASRELLAAKDGEHKVISRELLQTAQKLETVSWEAGNLETADRSDSERKKAITGSISEITERRNIAKSLAEEKTRRIQELDRERAALSSQTMEAKLRCSELSQRLNMLTEQTEPTRTRLEEMQSGLSARSAMLGKRRQAVREAEDSIEAAGEQIAALEKGTAEAAAELEKARHGRQTVESELGRSDADLARKRALCDELKDKKTAVEIKLAENTMKRQGVADRIASDYGMTFEQALAEPDPEWEDGVVPGNDWLDTRIAELRAKLDAMGPVNLMAIEEHHELEERFAFLTKQQADLVEGKQKLLNMISKINKTTSEMFSSTFAMVNENFDRMFRTLFNGGSAKLVLVDEENVLESGIEIIARPPGKKLQTVALLSGGERTLTAVSLLFAIYMIKPSPFCILDELDAPLDDSNIGRFVSILQGFLDRSQFLIITHSQQTIAAANAIYGVTMEEKGVSKTVSMKFSNSRLAVVKPETASAPAEPAPAAP